METITEVVTGDTRLRSLLLGRECRGRRVAEWRLSEYLQREYGKQHWRQDGKKMVSPRTTHRPAAPGPIRGTRSSAKRLWEPPANGIAAILHAARSVAIEEMTETGASWREFDSRPIVHNRASGIAATTGSKDLANHTRPPSTIDSAREWANRRLVEIENMLDADCLTIISPIQSGVEYRVKVAVEAREMRRDTLVVILHTGGGVVEIVERIVRVFRRHYDEIKFLIPDQAMSAGTVLAMSGDDILMDYHSCLGPIDPQLPKDGKLIPALSYLSQYEALIEKSKTETLSTAEIVLLNKLDLAELEQFRHARELSITLIERWLTEYKFKDWEVTETQQKPVTQEMKEKRARSIASQLNKHERWLTHGRGLDMRTLQDELKLKITDYSTNRELKQAVWDYFFFLADHMGRTGQASFVHSPDYF